MLKFISSLLRVASIVDLIVTFIAVIMILTGNFWIDALVCGLLLARSVTRVVT